MKCDPMQLALDGTTISPELIQPRADPRKVLLARFVRLILKPDIKLSQVQGIPNGCESPISVLIGGIPASMDACWRWIFGKWNHRGTEDTEECEWGNGRGDEGESGREGEWENGREGVGRAVPHEPPTTNHQPLPPSTIDHQPSTISPDLVVLRVNMLMADRFAKKGYTIIPEWVRMFLPLDVPLQGLLRRSSRGARWDVAKIEKEGYSCAVETGDGVFERFYWEQYLPTTVERFGPNAVVIGQGMAEKWLTRGELMFTRVNGRVASGMLDLRVGDTLWWPMMGLSEKARKEEHSMASSASYYFVIRHAYELGCRAINFGHCRPFLTDGVLRYKRKWRMTVVEDDDATACFAMKVIRDTPAVRAFLEANPFIYRAGGRLQVSGHGQMVNGQWSMANEVMVRG